MGVSQALRNDRKEKVNRIKANSGPAIPIFVAGNQGQTELPSPPLSTSSRGQQRSAAGFSIHTIPQLPQATRGYLSGPTGRDSMGPGIAYTHRVVV